MDSNKREQTDLNTNGNNVVLMLDSNDNDSMLSLKESRNNLDRCSVVGRRSFRI